MPKGQHLRLLESAITRLFYADRNFQVEKSLYTLWRSKDLGLRTSQNI